MHDVDFDINIDNLSKIEGHAQLELRVRGNRVESVKLEISENKRFYTQAIRGKPAAALPQLVSRICGTCSTAHNTCCTEALEYAFGVKPSEQTLALRELGISGLMVRDHAMHLYLFCLPDLYGLDSVLDFDDDNPVHHQLLHDAFEVKAAGNYLSTLVMGRAVHPTLTQIGGFAQIPDKEKLKLAAQKLKAVRPAVLRLAKIFSDCRFSFERETNFVALKAERYNFLRGEICSSTGVCTPEERFWDHLNRVVIPYSTATAFEFEGKDYMVGALSRMNLSKDALHKDTRRDAAEFIRKFPSKNVFHNNLAQAVEMVHCIDTALETIETAEFKPEPLPKLEPREANGVGVIEAPRGTLYYMLETTPQGTVRYGNLVIPTAQNQIRLENDIRLLVNRLLEEGRDRKAIEFEMEKLIRAYDPCMSCAAHFLKVKWEQA